MPLRRSLHAQTGSSRSSDAQRGCARGLFLLVGGGFLLLQGCGASGPSLGALAGRTAGSAPPGYAGATAAGGAGELPDGASVTGDASGSVLDGGVGGMAGTDGPAVGGSMLDAGAGGAGRSTNDGGSSACGDPGLACCSSNECKAGGCCVSGICMSPGGLCVGMGGGTCNAGACGTCGAAGLPCCGADPNTGACSAAGTTCRAGFCTKCGDLGVPCCAGVSGGAGTCNGAGMVCSNSLCVSCGTPGSACCPGGLCGGQACCYANLCLGENTACGTSGGTCQASRCSGCGGAGQACCAGLCYDALSCKNGMCSSCGHAGESCCAAGGGASRCQAGTVCSSNGGEGVCGRCGGLGDACCDSGACAEGCCSGGRCLAVSGGCASTPPGCGNGILSSGETCDDGNNVSGDGCSSDCTTVEPGWQCRVPGQRCNPACGDGILTGSETCDDGNATSGDGCSSTCQKEPGASCPIPGQPCSRSVCGNGVVEANEICDLGAMNGLFYGNGTGCSKTCTREPICRDTAGHNRACDAVCGDGNLDPGEGCDDGNLVDGDGCSSQCKQEAGFTCTTQILQDSSTCQSGTGQCLELPVIYRDFLPENAAGGHPDFYWLGTQSNGQVSRWCVPDSGGPAKANGNTARCWDMVASELLNGKPQFNLARPDGNLCPCEFSDWNVGNSLYIKGGYLPSESPLYDPSTGTYRADIVGYTSNFGPIWRGQVPFVTSADTFNQWFNDDSSVNQKFTGVIELASIGSGVYQYASKTHLMQGGFFPLDVLNPSQATLCNMWPYWHAWPTCSGEQYLMPPKVTQLDCPAGSVVTSGCWVANLTGQKHDNYFTDEIHYYFVYDATVGVSLQFYGDDDLFVFINGQLVLDLGGVHEQLPGKVTVSGDPGIATIVEGGCLDAAGNITGVTAGSTACSPTNVIVPPPSAQTPDDFRNRTVSLGLNSGKTYEIAIFGADRHPPDSNFQLTLNGYTAKQSICVPRCGDGIVSAAEECDLGTQNSDMAYGGCTTQCKFGPFCGDGMKNGPEECDLGKNNGNAALGADGCTLGCTKPL
jgi:cysteine-rich repeat protein